MTYILSECSGKKKKACYLITGGEDVKKMTSAGTDGHGLDPGNIHIKDPEEDSRDMHTHLKVCGVHIKLVYTSLSRFYSPCTNVRTRT